MQCLLDNFFYWDIVRCLIDEFMKLRCPIDKNMMDNIFQTKSQTRSATQTNVSNIVTVQVTYKMTEHVCLQVTDCLRNRWIYTVKLLHNSLRHCCLLEKKGKIRKKPTTRAKLDYDLSMGHTPKQSVSGPPIRVHCLTASIRRLISSPKITPTNVLLSQDGLRLDHRHQLD
jgi:hypothetical protein